jgi:hypothetical protein
VNYRGSYRKLLGNSKAAMVGAIEIYNKPRFDYRDETFVILVINAWELLLKAVVSKANKSIFYKKRRNQPYRTLSWSDALDRAVAAGAWPSAIPHRSVEQNLELLTVYRDNVVHFYNAPGFGVLVYALAQTSILNYRDLLREAFGHELGDEINWHLLPLGLAPPIDPIGYLRGARPTGATKNTAVDHYLKALRDATIELERDGIDTGRLLTVFSVSMQSTKKIERADIVVGVGAAGSADPVIVTRRVDPNLSHPLRRKHVLERLAADGHTISSYDFDAIVAVRHLNDDPALCWQDTDVGLVKWSADIVTYLKDLSRRELDDARATLRDQRRRGTAQPRSA